MDSGLQDRVMAAMTYFVGQGWTRAQAAGIVANLQAESGIESIAQKGGGPAFGIAQWEGPRQADFNAWAGVDIHDSTIEQQLEFVHHELTTTEKIAGQALRATTTAAHAGEVVCRLYERPADLNGQATYRATLAAHIDTIADFRNVKSGVESTAPKVG